MVKAVVNFSIPINFKEYRDYKGTKTYTMTNHHAKQDLFFP